MQRRLRNMIILLGNFVFGFGSILLAIIKPANLFLQMTIYIVYVLAAAFLAAATYLLIRFLRIKFREKILSWKLTRRLYNDYGFRTFFIGHLSFSMNILFAITKAVAGWYYSSVWLFTLALYYLLLCLTQGMILRKGRQEISGETAEDKQRREWKTYRLCGISLLLLTSTLQGVIILMVEQGRTYSYYGYLIYVVAMYDFYCMTASIIYMVKTRKKNTPLIVSIKSISFATSLVAMLTLQTAMFASFAGGMDAGWQKLMNVVTGTVVCGILIVLGLLITKGIHD